MVTDRQGCTINALRLCINNIMCIILLYIRSMYYIRVKTIILYNYYNIIMLYIADTDI